MIEYMQRHNLPAGFLDVPAHELHRLLPGPTLIELPGERDDALFVSTLQHGNEDTGLRAVQRLLAGYAGAALPRSLLLFVANPAAAREASRRLEGQADFNRCWPGTELDEGPVSAMLARLVDALRERPLFASVDIHNTTGRNPVYACVNRLDDTCLQLARRFAPTVVHFTRPRGLQAQAFLDLCPAVILECDVVDTEAGIAAAHRYLDELLRLDALPGHAPAPEQIELLRSVGLVQVPQTVRFGFGTEDPDAELVLDPDIDRLNFRRLPAGTALGRARGERWPVRMVAPDGREVTEDYFEVRDGALRLRHASIPSLLTPDARIVRQDCLCHLMEPFEPRAVDAA